ncbi:PREDICTED: receptor-interacting serine/threonine-protein kinase 2 [Cyprinodon variegatus]|uniref:receptor-interacting serine/threonine-protein kinase 2 n=1 Tax=Cyprinodon variegatus TaxID=28743 RepID=UPI0007427A8C|nr:PREDICTED: receptor-interacting serine/threonine-protein kinase 2 [Cyprinodon variegatus]
MERHGAVGCVNIGTLTSTLPAIPYQKLTDLYYLSRGGFGTVFKAQHSDWRTTVAIKCLKLDSVGERERNCLLKEAEVLHKARFNHIIQIFGVCNEPEFFCIVTEFMSNGSLDQLLHEHSLTSRHTSLNLLLCYAIIMWEVLSRQIPYEEVTNPMQIMFSVLRGKRPDTSQDSLSADIPSRETLISLMTSGWTANPDERPSFLKCLIELEPMVRRFDEIEFLEAVLEIKRSKLRRGSDCCSSQPAEHEKRNEAGSLNNLKEPATPWPLQCTSSASCSGSYSPQEENISLPGALISTHAASSKQSLPSSFIVPNLEHPQSLKDPSEVSCFQPNKLMNDLNIPIASAMPTAEAESSMENLNLKADHSPPLHLPATSQGPVARWIEMRREDIVLQMTEACLNQSLDALLARSMLMREDYELVVNQPTRTAKVRQLLDNCHKHDEDFCRIVVRKLVDNNQGGLKPYPPEICSPTSAAVPSAPPLSVSYSNHRNF